LKTLLVSSLEPSANLHLEPLLKELTGTKIEGIFDPKFGEPLYPSSDFSIMGFVDALSKIKLAKRAIKEMVSLSFKCEKVLLIDSPAFNLPLAKAIKEANPKTRIIYYILPQVWAWKRKRVKKIERYCDRLCSILPFEDRFYNKSEFVGHPLFDEIREFKNGVAKNGIVAFLPGSRKSEIKALMRVYEEVAKSVKEKKLLAVPSHFKGSIKEIYGDVNDFEIVYDAKEALLRSDFAFVCSGTATLEASFIGTPFVLVYKAKKIDYFIAKRFVKLKHIGLANIIFDFEGLEPLHKELIQDEVNAKNLLDEYINLDRVRFFERSRKLREILKGGSAKRVGEIIKN